MKFDIRIPLAVMMFLIKIMQALNFKIGNEILWPSFFDSRVLLLFLWIMLNLVINV